MKSRLATLGDVISGKTALKTGGDSRAELQFPDLTITRVGSNALFRFLAGGREMTLDGGAARHDDQSRGAPLHFDARRSRRLGTVPGSRLSRFVRAQAISFSCPSEG